MGRYSAISGFIGAVRFIKTMSFSICIELLNDSVIILRIILGNESFNTGRIKDGHIRFCRVNGLANGFCNINKVVEYEL